MVSVEVSLRDTAVRAVPRSLAGVALRSQQ